MSRKKKAVPDDCGVEGGGVGTISDQTVVGNLPLDCITSGSATEEICRILQRGAERGIGAPALAYLLRCGSDRAVRTRVNAARLSGAVILSGRAGYFLPSVDVDIAIMELEAFVSSKERQADSIRAITQSAREMLEKLRKGK